MKAVFEGEFADAEEVFSSFVVSPEKQRGVNIVYAVYRQGDWDGDAHVVFVREGKWFEVHGSHCSCYGLEGMWEPEKTSVAAMLRYRFWSDIGRNAIMNAAAALATGAPDPVIIQADEHLLY